MISPPTKRQRNYGGGRHREVSHTHTDVWRDELKYAIPDRQTAATRNTCRRRVPWRESIYSCRTVARAHCLRTHTPRHSISCRSLPLCARNLAKTMGLTRTSASEEAVEFNELDIFLRRREEWKPFEDEKTLLRAEPIGVPGAYSPLQMYPKHAPSRSPSPSPLAVKEKEKKEVVAGVELAEFGLQDVSVSMDELKALVEELGLGGEEANDLVKGLAGDSSSTSKPASGKQTDTKPVAKLATLKKVDTESSATRDEWPDRSIVKVSSPEETSADAAAESKVRA